MAEMIVMDKEALPKVVMIMNVQVRVVFDKVSETIFDFYVFIMKELLKSNNYFVLVYK